MKYKFKVTYEGTNHMLWEKVFRRKLAKSLKTAGRNLATTGPNSLKHHIKNAAKFSSRYPKNSIFYKASKDSRSVLYNIGFLRNAPRYEVTYHSGGDTFAELNVGFLDNVVHPSGNPLQKIINSVIKGGEWEPTDAQRKAYWAKMKNVKIESGSVVKRQETYKQPARDFMTGFRESANIHFVLNKSIVKALDETSKATKIKTEIGG